IPADSLRYVLALSHVVLPYEFRRYLFCRIGLAKVRMRNPVSPIRIFDRPLIIRPCFDQHTDRHGPDIIYNAAQIPRDQGLLGKFPWLTSNKTTREHYQPQPRLSRYHYRPIIHHAASFLTMPNPTRILLDRIRHRSKPLLNGRQCAMLPPWLRAAECNSVN